EKPDAAVLEANERPNADLHQQAGQWDGEQHHGRQWVCHSPQLEVELARHPGLSSAQLQESRVALHVQCVGELDGYHHERAAHGRAGTKRPRTEAEGAQCDEGDRARREHDLRPERHDDRAPPGDQSKGAHDKKRGGGNQQLVKPDVHRRGPLPRIGPPPRREGRVGAASINPLPSAADARITTRTASPTTYFVPSASPTPGPAFPIRPIGHEVVASTTPSKASRAATTAAPMIQSRWSGP